jgi:Na+-driven multidrug efflux pump
MLQFSIPSISADSQFLYTVVDQICIGQSVGHPGNTAVNVIFPLTLFGGTGRREG